MIVHKGIKRSSWTELEFDLNCLPDSLLQLSLVSLFIKLELGLFSLCCFELDYKHAELQAGLDLLLTSSSQDFN